MTYMPLGTTARKQGCVARENAVGGTARSQAASAPRSSKSSISWPHPSSCESTKPSRAGTTQSRPDDHKAYYLGAKPITIRVTGDSETGQLLGAQLVGAQGTETARRVDTYALALLHQMTVEGMAELDLSYIPPMGSPWDAVQIAAQPWVQAHRPPGGKRSSQRKPSRGCRTTG